MSLKFKGLFFFLLKKYLDLFKNCGYHNFYHHETIRYLMTRPRINFLNQRSASQDNFRCSLNTNWIRYRTAVRALGWNKTSETRSRRSRVSQLVHNFPKDCKISLNFRFLYVWKFFRSAFFVSLSMAYWKSQGTVILKKLSNWLIFLTLVPVEDKLV